MPAASGGVRAGKAFVELTLNDAGFRGKLERSVRSLNNFGKSLTSLGAKVGGLGALITAPFVASLKVFANTGSALDDLSQRTGESVENLSGLKFAIEQSGGSFRTLGNAMRQMQKNGFAPRTFAAVLAELAKIKDPVARAQKAFEIFGTKAGSELLPMIGNLDELLQKARDLGLTMDDETAKSAARLDDAFAALKSSVTAIAAAIGAAIAPAVSTLTELLTANLGTVIQWLKENGALVASLAALGAALTAAGTVLGAAGLAIAGLTAAVAALLTPVGLVAAGIVALGSALVATTAFTGHLQKAIRALTNELPAAIKLLAQYAKFRGLLNQINSGVIPPLSQLRGPAAPKPPTAVSGGPLDDPLGFGSANTEETFKRFFKSFEGVGDFLKSRAGDLEALKSFSTEFAMGFVDGLKGAPKKELAAAVAGIGAAESRGTFSGRFASQILGGVRDPAAVDRKKQIALTAKLEEHLAEIRRKTFLLRTGNK
jgi:hypothetical protein